jgi:hypothetical protein
MNLEQRYIESVGGYVALVKTQQAEQAGVRIGVNAFDGAARAPFNPAQASPEDQWQTEFKRNVAASFRYGNVGQNNVVPGAALTNENGEGGLSRFTSRAVKFAFNDATGRASILNRFKQFKPSSPVKWTDPTTNESYGSYHRYTPTVLNFVTSLPNEVGRARPRVVGPSKGPSPTRIGG